MGVPRATPRASGRVKWGAIEPDDSEPAVRDRLAGEVGQLGAVGPPAPSGEYQHGLVARWGWPVTAAVRDDCDRMLTNKNEVLAAALDQTNTWLAQTLGRPDLQLQLISQPIARASAMQFERGGGLGRKVHWNWEEIFFSRVRHQDAWMYAMVRAGRPRAMCYGRIQVKGAYVSLEYLERAPYARGIRGFTAPTAFQFARAVALLLDLTEVRLNEPFPHLVQYYERVLEGAIRHPAAGPVKYLSVKVST